MAHRPHYLKRQAGQSIIIAIAVMFILAFLASLFIILVARNLERTTRESNVLTADFYAQSGIRYADQMLLTSAQGADWRPPLQCTLAPMYTTPPSPSLMPTDELDAYNAIVKNYGLTAPATNDPDAYWLQQGFSRYPAQGGRFLIRVSYTTTASPTAASPTPDASPFDNSDQANAKYIKIESIGRQGEIAQFGTPANPLYDPTVFQPQPIRLHAEEVAYVPIGLTDYSRFITNINNRSDTANLGDPSTLTASGTGAQSIATPDVYDFTGVGGQLAPTQFPIVTTYGASTGANSGSGGSLRCNTNLRLYGENAVYLNSALGDDWEIAGNLTFDGYNPAGYTVPTTEPVATPVLYGPTFLSVNGNYDGTPTNVDTSTTTNFNSMSGLIRDGSTSDDRNGSPRSIKRLDPPTLDVVDPATKLNRYQAMTINGTAPPTGTVGAGTVNGGPYTAIPTLPTGTGLSPASVVPQTPATVYIDNAADIQQESTNVVSGAYTLRDDWVNRTSSYWQGPFYNPPGASIVFGPVSYMLSGGPVTDWGFTITRSDTPVSQPAGSPVTWTWQNQTSSGTTVTNTLQTPTITFVYSAQPAGYNPALENPGHTVVFLNAENPPAANLSTADQVQSNDIVIYAQGNVRVRGVVSNPNPSQTAPSYQHVTLVTGGIAYIEGSLLKGGNGYNATSTPAYASDSSISVLAEQYVCVNTTQFLAGSLTGEDVDSGAIDPGTNSIIFSNNTLTEAFDLPQPNLYSSCRLYLSQYSDASAPSYGHIDFNQNYPALGTPAFPYDGTNVTTGQLVGASTPNRGYIDLYTATGTTFAPEANVGYSELQFTFSKSATSAPDYLLERAAVLPSDVRIEGVFYAQNNSFFVIPGPWFNSDRLDAISNYIDSWSGSGEPTYVRHEPNNPSDGPGGATTSSQYGYTDWEFPFYGQPIDMKITIDGSVSENLPADISDQAAWMLKWGWIPQYQGSPIAGQAAGHVSTPTGSPAVGLSIQYDQTLQQPLYTPASGTSSFLRLDPYGRPLPYTPSLPVSPDLLYAGETPDASLVQ